MNKAKLLSLLKQEEGFKLDFKYKFSLSTDSDKREFVKDVIAMANTEGGRGYIIYGIEDKSKKIVGLTDVPKDMEERIQQIVASRSMPPVPINLEFIDIGRRKVGVLTIFKSRQIPHQMRENGAFYVRRGSTTDVAMRHEIATMLQSQGILSFEMTPCRQARLEDVELDTIEEQLGKYPAFNDHKTQMLRVLGIISEQEGAIYPTYGGLLLFGKMPQLFMPQTILRVMVDGKSFGISGNITKLMKKFEQEVKGLLPEDYPFEALKEVVGNAVIHRDYWNSYEYTELLIRADKIEVSNPSVYNYRLDDDVDEDSKVTRYNPWLYARLLLFLEQDENSLHFGIGLSRVKELIKDKGEVTTKVEKGRFIVTLPGVDIYKNTLH